jgi:hypothetical protein
MESLVGSLIGGIIGGLIGWLILGIVGGVISGLVGRLVGGCCVVWWLVGSIVGGFQPTHQPSLSTNQSMTRPPNQPTLLHTIQLCYWVVRRREQLFQRLLAERLSQQAKQLSQQSCSATRPELCHMPSKSPGSDSLSDDSPRSLSLRGSKLGVDKKERESFLEASRTNKRTINASSSSAFLFHIHHTYRIKRTSIMVDMMRDADLRDFDSDIDLRAFKMFNVCPSLPSQNCAPKSRPTDTSNKSPTTTKTKLLSTMMYLRYTVDVVLVYCTR